MSITSLLYSTEPPIVSTEIKDLISSSVVFAANIEHQLQVLENEKIDLLDDFQKAILATLDICTTNDLQFPVTIVNVDKVIEIQENGDIEIINISIVDDEPAEPEPEP